MKIIHVSAEATPYIHDGKLGETVGELAAAQKLLGHEVACILPGYSPILEGMAESKINKLFELVLTVDGRRETANVLQIPALDGVDCYLIERAEYYDRKGIYATRDQREFDDNDRRFVFFARAAVQALGRLNLGADIVHAHEWHTGLVPAMLLYQEAELVHEVVGATVFTIHDIRYQGLFPASAFALTGLPQDAFTPETLEFYGQLNLLKAGILYADAILIRGGQPLLEALMLPTADHGLLGLLRSRQADLHAIDFASKQAAKQSISLYESLL